MRYPFMQRKASSRYPASQYVLLTDEGEPECYEEAMTNVYKEKWNNAMQDEMDSLHENYTLETREDGSTPRYKGPIVVKGFQQKKGVNFDEIFAPIVKITSIRTVLSMATGMNLGLKSWM